MIQKSLTCWTLLQKKLIIQCQLLEDIVNKFKAVPRDQYILLIDGVEKYYCRKCTRYRVLNKAEQLRKHGFAVKCC